MRTMKLAAAAVAVAALSLAALPPGAQGEAPVNETIGLAAEAHADALQPAPRVVTLSPELEARLTAEPETPQAPAAPGPAPVETLTVLLDHAKVIRLPERTQTVIVGNPFIADVTVQRNGIVVVTGKSYGATNLIALDAQGLLLAESMVSVQAPTDSVVVVQRGLDRETYSCTPHCQPSLRLGDAEGFFSSVGSQATNRNNLAGQSR